MQEPEGKTWPDKIAKGLYSGSRPTLPNNAVDHELRDLRWRNKQLGKQLGKAGQKIHELRCELAEVREINGKIGRNHVRGLERQVEADTQTIVDLRILLERQTEYSKSLAEKLRVSEHAVTDA